MDKSNIYSSRTERKRFFENELLRAVPRILSRMDRCPESSVRGCLDREYWAWATKDFANMDMQRGLLAPAYLYKNSFPGNYFYGRKAIIEWISYGLDYWIRKQDRDGAFDHLYLNEGSWMAAAFTLADLVETLRLVETEIDSSLKNDLLEAMIRSGNFLLKYNELHGFISNHRIGAAAALARLAGVTGNDKFKNRAYELVDEVFDRRSQEGWFLEYEGADPGYQTLATHYLGMLYKETNDTEILNRTTKSLEFLSYFIHPDGSVGGEYGSRNCPHFFPGGFEVFAKELPIAEAIARSGVEALSNGRSSGLAESDGRNEVPLATSYVLAHQALSNDGDYPSQSLPWERNFERVWPEAGIYVRSETKKYFIFGAAKGGVVKVFDKTERELAYSSCGYAGELNNGRKITTHLWTTSPTLNTGTCPAGLETPLESFRKVEMTTAFFEFSPNRLMTPIKFLLFRVFNLTIGRIRLINDFVRKKLIINKLLKARKAAPLKMIRSISFNSDNAIIEDEIQLSQGTILRSLQEHGYFSSVYMASSKYFRMQDFTHSWSSLNLAVHFKDNILRRCKKIN